MPSDETNLPRIVDALGKHGVSYVLVGGLAVFLQGGETPTVDVDLAFSTEPDNLGKLADALEELNARPTRWKATRYRLNERDLTSGWLHLESDAGDIDLIPRTPGASYAELDRDHVDLEIEGVCVRIAAPSALIAMKRLAGRPRDKRHVEELEAIQKLRHEEGNF